MVSMVIVGIFLFFLGLCSDTKNYFYSTIYRVIPFLSGLYILLSQYNSYGLYFPFVIGTIGVYFIISSLVFKFYTRISKFVFNFLLFIVGLFLVLKFLHDINLI